MRRGLSSWPGVANSEQWSNTPTAPHTLAIHWLTWGRSRALSADWSAGSVKSLVRSLSYSCRPSCSYLLISRPGHPSCYPASSDPPSSRPYPARMVPPAFPHSHPASHSLPPGFLLSELRGGRQVCTALVHRLKGPRFNSRL